jgi:hypothetical protein
MASFSYGESDAAVGLLRIQRGGLVSRAPMRNRNTGLRRTYY